MFGLGDKTEGLVLEAHRDIAEEAETTYYVRLFRSSGNGDDTVKYESAKPIKVEEDAEAVVVTMEDGFKEKARFYKRNLLGYEVFTEPQE